MKKIFIITPPEIESFLHLKTLLGILKNHYEITVLTGDLKTLTENEKNLFESISFDGIQIMSSFQEWSLIELVKLTPTVIQSNSEIFHFLLPDNLSYKKKTILLSFAYIIKSIPGTQLSFTSSTQKSWWLNQIKALSNSEVHLETHFTRFSINEKNHPALFSRPEISSQTSSNISSRVPITRETIAQMADQWFIPFPVSEFSEAGLNFLSNMLNEFNFKIVINGWGFTSIFNQNKFRIKFKKFLERLIIKPMEDDEIPAEIFKSRGVILFGRQNELAENKNAVSIPILNSVSFPVSILKTPTPTPTRNPNRWNEQEFLFFINKYRTTFILEKGQIETLESHWKNGDTHWELEREDPISDFKKIINLNQTLKFQGLDKIAESKNHFENNILRTFDLVLEG